MTDKMREEKIVRLLRSFISWCPPDMEETLGEAADIIEQAAKSYPKDKPVECANGCPDKQVCDYCQSTPAAMMPCGSSVTNVYEAYEAGKKAAQSVPVVGEAVAEAYVYEDVDGDDILGLRLLKEDYPMQHGEKLYIEPTTSITDAEFERLRKDAERYRWLRYNASYSIHEMLFGKPAFITTHKESDLDGCIDAAIGEGMK